MWPCPPASTDSEHSVSTLKTVGLIGGGEEGEGVHEEKEDVPKNLEVGQLTPVPTFQSNLSFT